jgi:hypothetical protein
MGDGIRLDGKVAIVTGGGRIDIVAGGRATHNVKLYINEGTSKKGQSGKGAE